MIFNNLSLVIKMHFSRKDFSSMDTYNLILDICLLLCGIKGIKLQKDTLKQGYPSEKTILSPRDLSVKNHPGSPDYCREICPKLLILSMVMVLCGSVNILVEIAFPDRGQFVISTSVILLLAVIIWFGSSLSKTQKKHFNL